MLLAAADTYVIVLALPEMMAGLGIGADELQRATPIVGAFLLGYVATLPLVGRLADVYGPTHVLLLCFGIFALGSFLTASAEGLGMAISGRFLQGLGGGGLVPATLALVGAIWPVERRGVPLGVVGAVQEFGSVIGPLFGAIVLSVSDWRAIFWLNLILALVLATGLLLQGLASEEARAITHTSSDASEEEAARPSGRDPVALALVGAALIAFVVAVVEPTALATSVTFGELILPVSGESSLLSPIGIGSGVLLLLAAARDVTAPAAYGPVLGIRRLPRLAREVDLLGAVLLGPALAALVIAFAAADPQRQAVADGWPYLLAIAAVATGTFIWRQLRASIPLIPHGTLAPAPAWGALVVSLLVGAGLVAALVDVPIFARLTVAPDSQLRAAMVLLQMLVALPIGALAGGWLAQRWWSYRFTAGLGLALAAVGLFLMSRWDENALDTPGSTAALLTAGLGFGLAIAPVNAALLGATKHSVHGVVSALVVAARMVGMLVGLSALTAIGLRVFWTRLDEIGSPFDLCPGGGRSCPEYEALVRTAVLDELQAIFLGAAVCTALAAALALVLLRRDAEPA